jgi:hypothetical protein
VAWVGAPLLVATLVAYVCSWFGLIPAPDFPFDTAGERLGLAGSVCVVLAAALALAAGFLTRPLHAPGPRIAPVAAPASVAAATLAGLGIWLVNPYLGLLVALGLQAWVAAAARVGPGRLPAIGLVAAGALPLLGAIVALAVRFDAGPGVGADLLFMFTGGQLPMILALLLCLLGGSGLAIIALDGPPRPDDSGPDDSAPEQGAAEPEIHIESTRPDPSERGPDPKPEADEPAQPGRDPRLWSKPAGSSSRPASSRRTAPAPSLTRPISVSP